MNSEVCIWGGITHSMLHAVTCRGLADYRTALQKRIFEDFGEQQADHEIVIKADGEGSQQPPRPP